MCGGFTGAVWADDDDVDNVCYPKSCGHFPSGGGMEVDKCHQVDIIDYIDKDKTHMPCCFKEYWRKNEKCSPYGAPANSGVCKDYGKKKDVQFHCAGTWQRTDIISPAPTADFKATTDSLCKSASVSQQKMPVTVTSCTAKECIKGYLLQTVSSRKEIEIVKEEISGANQIGGRVVGSDGICREKSSVEKFCKTDCTCSEGQECVLNEFTVKNYGKNVQAFDRNRACVCVNKSCEERFSDESAIACCEANKDWDATNNTCKCADGEEWKKVDGTWKCEKKVKNNELVDEDGSPCKYILTVDITCPDGKTFHKNEQLTKEQYKDLACKDFNNLMKTATNKKITTIDFVKNIQAEVAAYNKLLETVCGKHRVPEKGMDVDSAKSTLTRFFANAKENASVWKTEDGNFNGSRLASDLTAGVVLGTVGGVVSSNVIKKNQIEKGFDVLHCTIGGQTVADWGDTFNTGLRK